MSSLACQCTILCSTNVFYNHRAENKLIIKNHDVTCLSLFKFCEGNDTLQHVSIRQFLLGKMLISCVFDKMIYESKFSLSRTLEREKPSQIRMFSKFLVIFRMLI